MKSYSHLIAAICVVVLVLSSASVIAGGYKRKVAYAGSYSPHRYSFEPDPEFNKIRSPQLLKDARPTGVVQTTRGPVPLGSRGYYRLNFQTQGTFKPQEWKAGAKLGNTFPQTIYNKDTGKGRALSRIFKP